MEGKRWIGVIAVVVIVAAIALAIRNWQGAGGSVSGLTAERDVVCEACKEVFVMELPIEPRPPYTCQKCGKKAVYLAVRCMRCGNVYAYHLDDEQPKCPACGSPEAGPVPLTPGAFGD
jgi:hypothetical protein